MFFGHFWHQWQRVWERGHQLRSAWPLFVLCLCQRNSCFVRAAVCFIFFALAHAGCDNPSHICICSVSKTFLYLLALGILVSFIAFRKIHNLKHLLKLFASSCCTLREKSQWTWRTWSLFSLGLSVTTSMTVNYTSSVSQWKKRTDSMCETERNDHVQIQIDNFID